jgi:hypothetical protein
VVGAAAALVALALGADDGAAALLVAAGAATVATVVPRGWRTATLARAAAVGAILLAVDLLVDGILGV